MSSIPDPHRQLIQDVFHFLFLFDFYPAGEQRKVGFHARSNSCTPSLSLFSFHAGSLTSEEKKITHDRKVLTVLCTEL